MMPGVSPGPAATAQLLVAPLGVALETWRSPLLLRGRTGATALLGSWAGGSRAVLAPGPPLRVAVDAPEPFAALDDLPAVTAAGDAPAGAVGGGWFGLLGYPLGRALEPVGGPPPRPVPLPGAALAYHDHVLRQDAAGDWWFEALVTPDREPALQERLADLRARAAALVAQDEGPRPVRTGTWRATPSAAGHAAAVAACVERIRHGDLFQANLCQRLDGRLEGDALDVFVRAWAALRPAKAAYVQGPWGVVASLSPELYLERHGRSVLSSPIKGTRPRGPDPVADEEAREELESAEKDRAEHVMIVDLVRNDLGRVCATGTVRVSALAQPREAPGVWHLVSDVRGELPAGVGDAELVRATFPPGSVTGAPKVAAMQVIHELESTGREAYTGAIGLAGPLAGLDLNVAIRTFEARGERIWLGVGGGIVADSTGAGEATEAADKAAPLLAAIGSPPFAADATPAPPPGAGIAPDRRAPVPLPRPEPGRGVFETILVRDGTAVDLDEHLARLTASTLELYGDAVAFRPLVAAARAAIATAGLTAGEARLRIDVVPGLTGRLASHAVCTPLPPAAPSPVVLGPVVVPGGFGPHKWADRRLWDALAERDPGSLPLAVDLDGLVLEAARSSVLARLADGSWVTPPLDGRILPGIARARSIRQLQEIGEAIAERPLPLGELRDAAEILIVNALRGAEPAVLGPARD
ncbi:aminodeoxychorismate synthase component I [Paraconexibacter algicola]|uniref:Aminodeoxychorismate synthase component I n=1 Tax=Paraconexibacter algicola TaxID=2133960 RepID=A0A2T4UBG6_9ACTN|nr:aminodeoxychorismate synthase component I [Paraconexibacter algicola]